MSHLAGKYRDTRRGKTVVVEHVPETDGYMVYDEPGDHHRRGNVNVKRPSEAQLERDIERGVLVPIGAGSVPDARGEGAVDPEFGLGGGGNSLGGWF